MELKIRTCTEKNSIAFSMHEKFLNYPNYGSEPIIQFIEQNSQHFTDNRFLQTFLELILTSIKCRPLYEKNYIDIFSRFADHFTKSDYMRLFNISNAAISFLIDKDKFTTSYIQSKLPTIKHNSLLYLFHYFQASNKKFEINSLNEYITESEKQVPFDTQIAQSIRSDDLDTFQSIISHANVSLLSKIKWSLFESMHFRNRENMPTLIEYAAYFGSLNIFKFLVLNQVLDSISHENLNKLGEFSVIGGNSEIIHIIESKGVVYNYQSLLNSIIYQHQEIIDYFLETYNMKLDKEALLTSVKACNLTFFFDNFADLLEQNQDQRILQLKSLWFQAVDSGFIEVIDFLLGAELGVDINWANDNGQTAIFRSVILGDLHIVNFLLKQEGINLELRDDFILVQHIL